MLFRLDITGRPVPSGAMGCTLVMLVMFVMFVMLVMFTTLMLRRAPPHHGKKKSLGPIGAQPIDPKPNPKPQWCPMPKPKKDT